MNYVLANYGSIISIVTGVVTVASIIAKLTPTPKDDAAVAMVVKVIDLLALNKNRSK